MATVVKMPKWGLTMTVGTVTDWLCAEGAEISAGDPIFTVETEKAVNDVEAPADGVLLRIVAEQGTEVPVSGTVAVIAAPGETVSDAELASLIAAASPQNVRGSGTVSGGGEVRAARVANRDDSGRINASPAARRRAQELGVDLAMVTATGPEGRITSEDVERAASADPTPREERISLADGRELNVLLAGAGDGPPLVFLHGLGGSQSSWQVVLGDLVERHRLVAIDLPGHGASSTASDADYSVGGLATAVSEALQSLSLKSAILIGHSLGGAVALRIAADAPERVAGVVAINTAGIGASISGELSSLMAGPAGEETARDLLSLFYLDQKLVAERGVAEMAQTQLAQGAWAAQQAAATASFAGDRQLDAARIDPSAVTVPVLLVWGDRDRVLPVTQAYEALDRFPDATLALVTGVGHVPQVENSSRAAALIDRFARSLS